ncbi:hypothetical protein COCOBI_07-4840 [Coccomyxa sp. Obi]|nr:hypothetical protein COCOBI_07-4840 [Coccomyxa sp. Obi]
MFRAPYADVRSTLIGPSAYTACSHSQRKFTSCQLLDSLRLREESSSHPSRSLSQHCIETRQLNKASVSATRPRVGMLAQWQRTALIAAAALDSPVLRGRVPEKSLLELRGDLLVLASRVLVRYAHTVQLGVAAAVLHKEWASAAGTPTLPALIPLAEEVEPVEAVNNRRLAPLSAEQRPRVATALAQSAATQQSLAATLEKVQAAVQRLKGLQEGNMSLRTDIGAEQIKLQAASQVLEAKLEDLLDMCSELENALDICEEASPSDTPTQPEDAEAIAMYEELLRKLQDSRAEAQAFVRVSHFIMDEALSKKESLDAHAHS